MNNSSLSELVNKSGFPLQIRLEQEIRSTEKDHKWKIVSSEHSWTSPDGSVGFIDLILEKSGLCLVIECKRFLDGNLVFLLDKNIDPSNYLIRLLWSHYFKMPDNDNLFLKTGYFDFPSTLSSHQASFCVTPKKDEDRYTIEKLAGNLISSIECLPLQEYKIESKRTYYGDLCSVFLPVIVIASELFVCHLRPDNVNLESGRIDNLHFEPVQFIRFRKSLPSTVESDSKVEDLGSLNKINERTLLIVRSSNIVDFLKGCHVQKTDSFRRLLNQS